jgi:hypothetical protein
MTTAMSETVSVNADGLRVLSAVAEEDQRPWETYVEEGLIVLLSVGDIILANRRVGKLDTHLWYEDAEGDHFNGEDLEGLLREKEWGQKIAPNSGMGVLDPFAIDGSEQTEIPIHPMLHELTMEMGNKLGFSLPSLVQLGIDLRRQIQVSSKAGEMIYVETTDPDELAVLPSGFIE